MCPDISMCANDETCGLAAKCYRSQKSGTEPSEYRQAWMNFKPSPVGCDDRLPVYDATRIADFGKELFRELGSEPATEDARVKEEG